MRLQPLLFYMLYALCCVVPVAINGIGSQCCCRRHVACGHVPKRPLNSFPQSAATYCWPPCSWGDICER